MTLAIISIRHQGGFPHGDLEEVYIEQPPGFVAQWESRGYVYHSHKALYGLKQSPRSWFGRFSIVIQQVGMIRNEANYSMFYRCSSNRYICLVVYVDYLVITGDDHDKIVGLKQHLVYHFQTKNLNQLRYFFGIEIT